MKLKKVVRERMLLTGESYTTAMMRVRECKLDLRDEFAASISIEQSPPRLGSLLIRPRGSSGTDGLPRTTQAEAARDAKESERTP